MSGNKRSVDSALLIHPSRVMDAIPKLNLAGR